MHYHNITTDDMLNGDGLRTVLWVAGCEHGCKGCQNPITWAVCGGIPFDEAAEAELFSALSKPYISGLTLSGGDPLHPLNRSEATRLARKAKSLFPNKTVWLYSGYTYEQAKDWEIMNCIDVFVDGKYVEDMRDTLLWWRGSSNQRVIDVPKTLLLGNIVLRCE